MLKHANCACLKTKTRYIELNLTFGSFINKPSKLKFNNHLLSKIGSQYRSFVKIRDHSFRIRFPSLYLK